MDCDVIVIGSGQAGVPLAARLAEAGRRVVLAERSHLGGSCVNYGCTPSKTIIACARTAHVARTASEFGIRTGDVRVDLGAVVDRKERMVQGWRDSVAERLESAGDRLRLVRGHARFTAPRTVRIGEDEYRADVVVINTGARPVAPPVPGLSEVPWLDNSALMALRELPEHLLVIGGGYIGCELGQAYRRLGAEVTLLDHNPRILSREDPEVSEALQEVFADEGIAMRLGSTVREVASDGAGIAVRLRDGEVLTGSHLLVATGRRPSTDDLGIEAAGLALDEQGGIPVDDHYRTGVDGVYAVGDVTGGAQFTHASWDDHRILFDLLEGNGGRTRADRLIPYAVFTDPQVGRVGLSESEARRRGIAHESARMPFARIARANETGRPAGTLSVVIDPADERVLGATIVGAEAAELIHIFVALMSAGAPARALVEAEAVHPTFAEGVQSVVMQLDRYAL
jgi:pyruvate/2-oxoglutarate dehydrogenase complex dihydrolipoamide dehydrogenase (E3) component